MTHDISITVSPEKEKDFGFIQQKLFLALSEKGIQFKKDDVSFEFVKKSVDARHGKVKLFLRYRAFIGEQPGESEKQLPVWKKADSSKRVIVIGSGPAGLFGALKLLEYGICPIIVERGNPAPERKRDIALISTQTVVNPDSNYCFGEGGAGTFSDGKLYTRSNKRGDISQVLKIFAHFGADKKILTDAHPHIGTDRLPQIIMNMRNKITELGGEIPICVRNFLRMICGKSWNCKKVY